MSKKKTQNILNVVIVLLVIMLIIMVVMVLYESKINENKDKNITNAQLETSQKQENEIIENNTINDDEEEQEKEEEYIGEEEKESQEEVDEELTKDEKAIQLAKEKWGIDDNTVTYSIEEKKGNIYYIAVKSNATTISWYEVNTETWEISEFY